MQGCASPAPTLLDACLIPVPIIPALRSSYLYRQYHLHSSDYRNHQFAKTRPGRPGIFPLSMQAALILPGAFVYVDIDCLSVCLVSEANHVARLRPSKRRATGRGANPGTAFPCAKKQPTLPFNLRLWLLEGQLSRHLAIDDGSLVLCTLPQLDFSRAL